MVEVPNAPVPPHPVAPAGACAGDAEDAAAAADLAATGVQTALEIVFAVVSHHR